MKKNYSAFTLAEVLITLGIIGVVAAITIPGLITNNRARVLHSKYLKSYSVISQMMKLIEGDDIALDSSMLSQVGKYLKGSTYCGSSSIILNHAPDDSPCFYSKSGRYKTYDGKKLVNASEMDDAQYALPDGTLFLFEWDTLHYKDGSHCWIFTDINGYKNGPNRWGVDLFTFQIIDGKMLAMGDPGTLYTDLNKYCNISSSDARNGISCAYLAKSDVDYFKKVVKLK